MAMLSQLHLARTATQFQLQLHVPRASAANLQLPNATARFPSPSFRRASSRSLIPSLRISKVVAAATRIPEDFGDDDDDDDEVVRSRDEFDWGWFLGVVAAGVMTPPAWPAHAVIKDEVEEMMRFTPEAWVNIYITTGIWLVLYFLLIPLGVYNYLRLRWYKRSFLETYFQFMLVFIFFPGMLLLAPFINFRRLPKDGAEEP